eukprot:2613244-Karenia_brevis.AAC.1
MVLGNRGVRPFAKDCVEPAWLINQLVTNVKDNGRHWLNVNCYDTAYKSGCTPDLMALAEACPWLSLFLDPKAYPYATAKPTELEEILQQ